MDINPHQNRFRVTYDHPPRSLNYMGCQYAGALCVDINWRSGIGTVETWEHGTWDPQLYPVLEESPFQLWRCPQ